MGLISAARRGELDRTILVLVLALASIGLLMVYSVTQPLAEADPYAYLRRQAVNVVVGIILMILISRCDLKKMNDLSKLGPLMAFLLILLVLCWVPPFADPHKNAARWIKFAGVRIQPSELTKASLLFFFAYYLSHVGEGIRRFWRGVVPMALVTVPFLGLIAKEPDLGGAAIIGLMLMAMLYLGGVRLWVLGTGAAIGTVGIVYEILAEPWRVRRILGFLNPGEDRLGVNYQSWNALIAIGRGGVFGVGVGNGWQKYHYVPDMHTDFILANVGEELGLIGLLVVGLLFFSLVRRALKLTMKAEDPFVRFTGTGAAILLATQLLVNAGVVMAMLPNKGLALPFFSYGGSNTLLNFILVGIVLSAARQRPALAAHSRKVMHLLPQRLAPGNPGGV